MKPSIGIFGVIFAALFAMTALADARAAEIKVLGANGLREVMEDLAPKFERSAGYRLAVSFATLGTIVGRVQGGETADLVALPQQGIEQLIKDGKAEPGTVAVLARAGIGIAVRNGAPKPDISTPEALRGALLEAKTITFLDPAAGGVSGAHFARVLERLGIAAEMKSKTILHANARAAGALVANGEAEIGINLVQELKPLPGIDVVGPLPPELQNTIVYAGAIITGSNERAAAKAFLDFLRTSEAAGVIAAKGMDPS